METTSIKELVLTDTAPDSSVQRLVAALGATFTVRSLREVIAINPPFDPATCALIVSEEQLLAASAILDAEVRALADVFGLYSHVLICPFAATPNGLNALGQLVGARIQSAAISDVDSEYVVCASREMCGPFSDLRFGQGDRGRDRALTVHEAKHETDFIVSLGGGGLFTRFKLRNSEIFVSACATVFDVTAEHRENLAAAKCFSELAPLLFFIRHAKTPLLQTPSPWANWIVDDPNLKPRYGFLSIPELAESICRLEAAATIAFIPWNHSRTSAEVTELFRTRWPQLSICVHGCDHTQFEFSTRSVTDTLQLTALAMSRMRELESRTAVGYEKVMVFPQGKFTRVALSALRQSGLLAAVNTELVDSDSGEGVTGGELLQPVIMSYGGFPLFMRRPPDEPLANFALDLLLGKPCLIVTHHDYFREGMGALISRIESLNRVQPALRWTNLENGIATTYSVRRSADRTADVRLFGARADLQFDFTADTVFFTKSESISAADLEVRWNDENIPFRSHGGELTFSASVSEGQPLTVEVKSMRPVDFFPARQTAGYRGKVAARRYLSELRDNYIHRW